MKKFIVLARFTLLVMMLMLANARSAAAINCDAFFSGSQMRFGEFSLLDGGVRTAVATLTFGCSGAPQPLEALLCISLGSGPTGDYGRRYLQFEDKKLGFNLYKDASLSSIWGSIDAGGSPSGVAVLLPLAAHKRNVGTIEIHGAISTTEQAGSPRGWYDTSYMGGWPVKLSYTEYQSGTPVSCDNAFAGMVTTNLYIQAIAMNSCRIDGTSDMNFGTVPNLQDRSVDSQSSISVTCNGTAYRVGLSNGLNPQGQQRRMRGPDGHIAYELFRDANRSQRWGNNMYTDAVSGTGTGSAQTLTVYGRVPQQAFSGTGSYSDTITVTVDY